MRLAYLILAHKNPEQLARLISKLTSHYAEFYIHIDKKSNYKQFEKAIKEKQVQSVHFVKSHNVHWATISQTNARLELLRAAFFDKIEFTHYVMLSGQTYPVQPVASMLAFLRKNKNVSFIEHNKLPYNKLTNGGLDRINCYTFRIGHKLFTHLPKKYHNTFSKKGKMLNMLFGLIAMAKGQRKKPANVTFYYGIDWWILAHDAVKYLINFLETHPEYHAYHKYTRHTCEVYFPTILCGTHFNGKVVNDSLHFMKWKNDGSGNPKILINDDYNQIRKSDSFFARKFDEKIDSTILDRIDEEIL